MVASMLLSGEVLTVNTFGVSVCTPVRYFCSVDRKECLNLGSRTTLCCPPTDPTFFFSPSCLADSRCCQIMSWTEKQGGRSFFRDNTATSWGELSSRKYQCQGDAKNDVKVVFEGLWPLFHSLVTTFLVFVYTSLIQPEPSCSYYMCGQVFFSPFEFRVLLFQWSGITHQVRTWFKDGALKDSLLLGHSERAVSTNPF